MERAATFRYKLQIKAVVSPTHGAMAPGPHSPGLDLSTPSLRHARALSIFLLCSPAVSLGFTHLREIFFFFFFFAYVTVFNPTIEVVTFRLRGLFILGVFCVFLVVAGIHPPRTWMLGYFEYVRWNACVHRLDLGLYSHPKDFFAGNIPSMEKNLPRGVLNPWRCTKQDSEPNTLPTSYSGSCPSTEASMLVIWLDRELNRGIPQSRRTPKPPDHWGWERIADLGQEEGKDADADVVQDVGHLLVLQVLVAQRSHLLLLWLRGEGQQRHQRIAVVGRAADYWRVGRIADEGRKSRRVKHLCCQERQCHKGGSICLLL